MTTPATSPSSRPRATKPAWSITETEPGPLERLLARLIQNSRLIAVLALLVGIGFAATPPTVSAILAEQGSPVWSIRVGPFNIFELSACVAIALLALSYTQVPWKRSSFDRPLFGVAVTLAGVQLVALALNHSDATFLPLDIERLGIAAIGYILVTRTLSSPRHLKRFVALMCGVILFSAVLTTFRYGILGDTEFGTILGRKALLITEDTLLLLIPLTFACGLMIDGRLTAAQMLGVAVLVVAVSAIELLSLRRGAILMISSALVLRTVLVSKRMLLYGVGILFIVSCLAFILGPARHVADDVKYIVKSSLLQTEDDSTSQRTSEIVSLRDNLDAIEWLTGAGVGVTWQVTQPTNLDALSFGSGESENFRIGWHVYGLDWLYKFGLLGIGLLFFLAVLLLRRLRYSYKKGNRELHGVLLSAGACIPPLVLLLFTNPRVALMAGVFLGILSLVCDFDSSDDQKSPGLPRQ